MFEATVTMADGTTEPRTVYDIYDVQLPDLKFEPRGRGAKKDTPDYFDALCCLDTETSKLTDRQLIGDETVLLVRGVWIYQWCMGINDVLIAGRTADELLQLVDMLIRHYQLSEKRRLVCWIHNAPYDLSYLLNGLWQLTEGQVEIFATGQRRPVKCTVAKGLEFRCSYKLTNRSLAAWCDDCAPIPHKKLVGAIDYNVIRTPSTQLTSVEWDYMINDVLCQQDCLRVTLRFEKLRTVPMTSTGFVRRAMLLGSRDPEHKGEIDGARKDRSWRAKFVSTLPTADQYILLNQAFTGGYTHCNSLSMGIWHDVTGVDAASMYPAVLATERFPMGKWEWRDESFCKYEVLRKQIWRKDQAIVAMILFEGLQMRDFSDWHPYLSFSRNVRAATGVNDLDLDNGKVIYCKYFMVALTEIDMRVVFAQYTWDHIVIVKAMTCRKAPLPVWFLNGMRKWYADKVQLKEGPEGETEEDRITRRRRYVESKQRLNAIYGMCATAWSHDVYKFDFAEQAWSVPENKHTEDDINAVIEKMKQPYSKAFLRYDWGLYCTAYARASRLWTAMEYCGHPIYCDTDSVKGDEWDWDGLAEYNKELRDKSDAVGYTIKDARGHDHPIGVFEPDGEYARFSALHAKCYAYETVPTDRELERKDKLISAGTVFTPAGNILHCTIAGVTATNGKVTGDPDLVTKEMELGSLENLTDGHVFRECGGTRSVYIDHEHDVYVNGEFIHSYGGCAILDTSYEIGGTNDLLAMYALSDPQNAYK